jgi:hypothetical protein
MSGGRYGQLILYESERHIVIRSIGLQNLGGS